jgi:hypothetical protein
MDWILHKMIDLFNDYKQYKQFVYGFVIRSKHLIIFEIKIYFDIECN